MFYISKQELKDLNSSLNKYNLTIAKLKKYKILNRDLIKEPLFWRNNIINAWCINKIIGTNDDRYFGTDSEYWIGIYDNNKFKFNFSSYGGMCDYVFSKFFKQEDIENYNDLKVQVEFLKEINELIDLGIIGE